MNKRFKRNNIFSEKQQGGTPASNYYAQNPYSNPEQYKGRASQNRMVRAESALARATKSNTFAVAMFIVLTLALIVVGIHAALFPKEESTANSATSTYNWDYLKKENGRFSYVIEGKAQSLTGIDVSEHQGYIDWKKVKSDGIAFAFIRVGNRGLTTGSLSQDDYFEYNVNAATQAGIKVGVYFFSQAITEEEAREEADFVLERIKGRSITYPVVYDHERLADNPGRADNLSAEQMNKNATAFCERIEQAGYTPMIYGSMKDLLRYNLTDLGNYNIWLAQYDVNSPTFNQLFSFWQYTNTGSVAGIDGNVDMNIQLLGNQS